VRIWKISTCDCQVVLDAYERWFRASDGWRQALGRDRLGFFNFVFNFRPASFENFSLLFILAAAAQMNKHFCSFWRIWKMWKISLKSGLSQIFMKKLKMATGSRDLEKFSSKSGLSQISTKMATGSWDLEKFQRNLDLAKFSRKWQQVHGT